MYISWKNAIFAALQLLLLSCFLLPRAVNLIEMSTTESNMTEKGLLITKSYTLWLTYIARNWKHFVGIHLGTWKLCSCCRLCKYYLCTFSARRNLEREETIKIWYKNKKNWLECKPLFWCLIHKMQYHYFGT